jgi:hypothetical protein
VSDIKTIQNCNGEGGVLKTQTGAKKFFSAKGASNSFEAKFSLFQIKIDFVVAPTGQIRQNKFELMEFGGPSCDIDMEAQFRSLRTCVL